MVWVLSFLFKTSHSFFIKNKIIIFCWIANRLLYLIKLNCIRTKHNIKIEDLKTVADIEERKWKSCCFQLEPESSIFFAKLIVSILVILLCSYQLISLEGCTYQSLYSSILSSIITFWLTNKK